MKKIIHIWGDPFKELEDIKLRHSEITEIIYESIFEINFIRMNIDQYFFFKLLDVCKFYNIPLTVWTSNSPRLNSINFEYSNDEYKDIKFVYWDTFWITRTYNLMSMPYNHNHNLNISSVNILDDSLNLDNRQINFLFCSYNNIAKTHRIKFMNMLAKYDLFKNGYISWRDIIRAAQDEIEKIPKNVLHSYYFYPELYTDWDPKILILDQSLDDVFNQEILPPFHLNSFVEIVTESDDNLFFISEKTSKPLLSKVLFLVIGSVNFHKNLQKLGFKLYDEIFDYSFDSYADIEYRIAGVIKNLLKYQNYSSEEFLKLIKNVEKKIIYNYNLAIDYAVNIIPDEVKKLLKDNQIAMGQPIDINNVFKLLEDA